MTLICKVAIAPVRAEASDRGEMTTQLLFGEMADLQEEQGAWIRVKSKPDNYEGWVDKKQMELWAGKTKQKEYVLATSLYKTTTDGIRTVNVPAGSMLRDFSKGKYTVSGKDKWTYSGRVTKITKQYSRKNLESAAGIFIGAPYLWGGRTPFGVDCSGLVQQLFRFAGISLPRDAWQQAMDGKEVPFQKIKFGDLAFFRNPEGRIVHVGIIWNPKNKQILHASGEVRIDRIEPEGIIHAESGKHTHVLAMIKRVI